MSGGLKEKQKNVLLKLINFNSDNFTSRTTIRNGIESNVWKVIVYDTIGFNIILPLIRIPELRKNGVTLHLHITSSRHPIPDVPAIYFISPTTSNINSILEDAKKGLYDTMHINFISPISEQLLTSFATKAVDMGVSSSFSKIYDQFLHFMTPKTNLFTLNLTSSYSALHDPKMPESEIRKTLDSIVDGIFCSLVTSGSIPIIRAPKGLAAEMIAKQLDEKIRKSLTSSPNPFADSSASGSGGSFERPILILLDRDQDIPVVLHHTWTYQALVSELIGFKNGCTVELLEAEQAGGPKKLVKHDLEDEFFEEFSGQPFVFAAEEADERIRGVKEEIDRVAMLSSLQGVDMDNDAAVSSKLADSTKELSAAVSKIPELRAKKKSLNGHTAVLTEILERAKGRRLNELREMELTMIAGGGVSKSEMLNFIKNEAKPEEVDASADGTPSDKLRLFLTYFLTNEVSSAELESYEAALSAAGCDLAPLDWFKKQKSLSARLTSSSSLTPGSPSLAGLNSPTAANAGKMINSMFGTLSSVKKQAQQGLNRALRSGDAKFKINEIVESLMENKPSPLTDDFIYLDPKVMSGAGAAGARSRNPYREGFVFTVGGGCFTEYEALQSYARGGSTAGDKLGGVGSSSTSSGGDKTIIYGTTELLTGDGFLAQLADVANAGKPKTSNGEGAAGGGPTALGLD